MSLIYPAEDGSVMLYPTSQVLIPFLCSDHRVSHAGFDLLWGLDCRPWALVSQLKQSEPGSVIQYFPEIAANICQLFMPHIEQNHVRWFCWYQTLSHGIAFDEIGEASYCSQAQCFDAPSFAVERAVHEHLLSSPTWMKAA